MTSSRNQNEPPLYPRHGSCIVAPTRQHGGHGAIGALTATDVAITLITAEEQLQGRLAVIRRASTQIDAARGYERLYEAIRFYSSVTLVLYDAVAAARFDELRGQGIRIGTHDLRIAAIALTQGTRLVTRNTRDFNQVPELLTEDWSQPR